MPADRVRAIVATRTFAVIGVALLATTAAGVLTAVVIGVGDVVHNRPEGRPPLAAAGIGVLAIGIPWAATLAAARRRADPLLNTAAAGMTPRTSRRGQRNAARERAVFGPAALFVRRASFVLGPTMLLVFARIARSAEHKANGIGGHAGCLIGHVVQPLPGCVTQHVYDAAVADAQLFLANWFLIAFTWLFAAALGYRLEHRSAPATRIPRPPAGH